MNQQQFENFTASSLYCEKCRAAMPVRERLLLVLPDREIFDYLCTECGSSVGRREITAGEKLMAQAMSGRSRRAPASIRLQSNPKKPALATRDHSSLAVARARRRNGRPGGPSLPLITWLLEACGLFLLALVRSAYRHWKRCSSRNMTS